MSDEEKKDPVEDALRQVYGEEVQFALVAIAEDIAWTRMNSVSLEMVGAVSMLLERVQTNRLARVPEVLEERNQPEEVTE